MNSLAEEVFLSKTTLVQAQRSTVNKSDFMILKASTCMAKDIVIVTRWQPAEWESIFTNYTYDRGLLTKICKEFKELDI